MADKIKVLVVDDTAFMRKALTRIFSSDPDLSVVGSARNGLEALDKIRSLRPDVITLDIDMPVMDGLSAIRHVMIESPLPIVALSSLFNDGAITFEALRLGVVDFVPKPSGAVSRDIETSENRLIERVKMACGMNLGNVRRVRLPRKWSMSKRLDSLYRYYPLDYLIAVGTTLSGPNTVIRLLSRLSPTLPTAVVVVKEIHPRIIASFAQRFNEYVPWKVIVAADGMVIEQGTCYVSSHGQAVDIRMNEKGEACIFLAGKTVQPLNLLYASAARIFRQNTVGILLTGVGDDGAEGLRRIKEAAGVTIVQDVRCCVFPNLTDNAIRQGVADMILDESELSKAITSLMT